MDGLEVSAHIVRCAPTDEVEDIEVGAPAAMGVRAASHVSCLLASHATALAVVVRLERRKVTRIERCIIGAVCGEHVRVTRRVAAELLTLSLLVTATVPTACPRRGAAVRDGIIEAEKSWRGSGAQLWHAALALVPISVAVDSTQGRVEEAHRVLRPSREAALYRPARRLLLVHGAPPIVCPHVPKQRGRIEQHRLASLRIEHLVCSSVHSSVDSSGDSSHHPAQQRRRPQAATPRKPPHCGLQFVSLFGNYPDTWESLQHGRCCPFTLRGQPPVAV